MDPLSITASTLTILLALDSAFKLVKSYRDAPAQLEALSNEIVDLTAAVTEAARVIKESQGKTHSLGDNGSLLALALLNIRDKSQELETLFRSCVIPASSATDGSKVSRVSWLKVRSKVQTLQNELRASRLNLSIALATFTA